MCGSVGAHARMCIMVVKVDSDHHVLGTIVQGPFDFQRQHKPWQSSLDPEVLSVSGMPQLPLFMLMTYQDSTVLHIPRSSASH